MTDYNKKYLKYKKKYFELKKINNQQIGGELKTIGNTGSLEGMKYQCFWISILDYLKINGYPDLTLKQLRTEAGLGKDTEETMFDIDYLVGPELDRQPIFFNAATRIAEKYNLRIQIYSTHIHNGNFELSTPRGLIGDGSKLVEIAQFGIDHFELIDANHGENFVPAVVDICNGNLTKDINPQIKNAYYQLTENKEMLKILKDELANNMSFYNKENKNIEDLKESNELTPTEKEEFLKETNLTRFVENIMSIQNKIKELDEENSSLELIINNYEISKKNQSAANKKIEEVVQKALKKYTDGQNKIKDAQEALKKVSKTEKKQAEEKLKIAQKEERAAQEELTGKIRVKEALLKSQKDKNNSQGYN
jgi:hypothetical protein